MLEKLTLDAAWGFVKKTWPFMLIALASAMLLITQHQLSTARKSLVAEASFRSELATIFGSKTTDTASLLGVAHARDKEKTEFATTLTRISNESLANKKRADAADAALKKEQAENARKFAAAQRTIADLQGRKPTGNRDADWKVIEEDSKAAWKGWRK
ncbi:hypothetical protein [Sphingomonas jaspsi]|uniref:hypothetical protein n=1 Tax=Sphingomonas jaspsi TaxID=392409 RepID=UPI0004B22A16|nr:hypothetical protein [Sphingomonas jaspsi]